MTRFVSLVFLICCACIVSLHAQDTAFANLPKQWRLQDCIEYAKKKNISIALLRLTSQSKQEDILQAKAGVLPDLTGTVSQSIAHSNNTNIVVGGFQSQSNFSSNYGLNSSMVLYRGGYLKNDIRSKEFSLESANLSVKETENNLTLSITQAFFNILLAKETIASFESVLATSEAQLKQGQQRFDAGGIAKKDLLQLQSQAATDQYNLINETSIFKLNTVILKQLLLLPTVFNLKIIAPDSIPVQQALAALPQAQIEAEQTRPEIQNKEIQIKISQTELDKVYASVKPTISLGASLATGYSDRQNSAYMAQLNNNFYQSLGVNMGIPFYSRRVNKTAINKSKIELLQSRLTLYDTKSILNQQVEQIYINLLNAQAEYTAAETRLKISEQLYFITNEQLKLGAVNIVELLQEKNTYIQALQNYIKAKYSAALYNKIYEFYTGIPITF